MSRNAALIHTGNDWSSTGNGRLLVWCLLRCRKAFSAAAATRRAGCCTRVRPHVTLHVALLGEPDAALDAAGGRVHALVRPVMEDLSANFTNEGLNCWTAAVLTLILIFLTDVCLRGSWTLLAPHHQLPLSSTRWSCRLELLLSSSVWLNSSSSSSSLWWMEGRSVAPDCSSSSFFMWTNSWSRTELLSWKRSSFSSSCWTSVGIRETVTVKLQHGSRKEKPDWSFYFGKLTSRKWVLVWWRPDSRLATIRFV